MEPFKEHVKERVQLDEKEKLIELFSEDDKSEYYSIERQGEIIANLNEHHKKLMDSQDFKIGDIVQWKPGLKNKRRPYQHEPAIVVDILEPPLFDETQDSGSSYFREPLDMVIGIADYSEKR
ncbi:hypothetical protein BGP_4848 [Beggiatoa sp. PS]|nr:hypothetical protein BGP_4848 [Beggiatoa sp. PS]